MLPVSFTLSEHFSDLKKVEEELRRVLRQSLSMMKLTALFFAPLVCGLIITLQAMIQRGIERAWQRLELASEIGFPFIQVPLISVEILQLLLGVYVLLITILLIRFISLIEYGEDEVMLRIQIYRSLPISLLLFTLSLFLSRAILY